VAVGPTQPHLDLVALLAARVHDLLQRLTDVRGRSLLDPFLLFLPVFALDLGNNIVEILRRGAREVKCQGARDSDVGLLARRCKAGAPWGYARRGCSHPSGLGAWLTSSLLSLSDMTARAEPRAQGEPV
jgi:hypothetical protein